MRFRPGAQLNTGQVRDRRGGRGVAVGGGVGTILIVIVLAVLGVDVPGGATAADRFLLGSRPPTSRRPARPAATPTSSEDCRIVGVVNSVQAYWSEHGRRLPRGADELLHRPDETGCGAATSAVGPFYCPADQRVYIDLSFFDELRSRFGARGGPFAEAYVIAHEYGHHIQHLLGTDEQRRRRPRGPDVGLGAARAAGRLLRRRVGRARGRRPGFIEDLTDADIADGLDAAAAVGDDRIQSGPPAASIPRAGPTARPPRASGGSHRLPHRRPAPLRHVHDRSLVDEVRPFRHSPHPATRYERQT